MGEPFIGPAGCLPDRVVRRGLERTDLDVTNAVTHFEWKARGQRRVHEEPNRTDVLVCHQWLEWELGVLDADAVPVATMHPSADLRRAGRLVR